MDKDINNKEKTISRKQKRTISSTTSDKIFDFFLYVFMVLLLVVMIYPIYFTVIASFSEPRYVSSGLITFLPRGFTFEAYQNVFRNSAIWTGYTNSLFYTITGTLLALFLTLPAAYALSKKQLRGRIFFSWYFLFTMFFSGGLIPFFLTVRNIGLVNQPYTLAILGSFSVMNMVVTRIFYQISIPDELYEAAKVDGCSDFGQFFKIALPLSAPIIAVMALFYAVARWNDFFTALVFVFNRDYFPLQLVLRNILIEGQISMAEIAHGLVDGDEMLARVRQAQIAAAMRYAIIFIASAPLLIAYPFVQKFFVKGVMIGSLKG